MHQLDLDGDGVLSREEIELAMESIDLKKRPDAQQFEERLLTLTLTLTRRAAVRGALANPNPNPNPNPTRSSSRSAC